MATLSIGGGNWSGTVFGNSKVYAGNGNDAITVSGGTGLVDVGSGSDNIEIYDKGTVVAGSGDDSINIGGAGQVTAGGGNDSITLHNDGHLTVGAGFDTISLIDSGTITQLGTAGVDTISPLGYGSDTIFEAGKAFVGNPYGTATIAGGELKLINQPGVHTEDAVSGKATLVGGEYSNMFVGGTGSVVMKGGLGADTFVGGSGSDTMTGGSNTNLFEFLASEKGGSHVITNFVAGQDQLYLEGNSLSYLQAQHDITVSGGNTFISLDGGATTIELKGVTNLTSSDITTHK